MLASLRQNGLNQCWDLCVLAGPSYLRPLWGVKIRELQHKSCYNV